MTISVIVPIYKVEAYLQQCVDSVLAQTYTDLDIVLVDDGSPDNCPAICDAYARKDARVQVVHKPNGGLMSARQAGLRVAKGDYVGFVDGDDWIEPDMYARFAAAIDRYAPDMALCEFYYAFADHTSQVPSICSGRIIRKRSWRRRSILLCCTMRPIIPLVSTPAVGPRCLKRSCWSSACTRSHRR